MLWMVVVRLNIGLAVMAACSVVPNVVNGQLQGRDGQFLREFRTWRNSHQEFACAALIESTLDDNVSPTFSDRWILYTSSKSKNARRLDVKDVSRLSSDGAVDISHYHAVTTFVREDEVIQVFGKQRNSIRLRPDDPEDFKKIREQPLFNPFNVVLLGWGSFVERPVAPQARDPLDRLLESSKQIQFTQAADITRLTLRQTPQAPIFDVITLDRRSGNMPVSVVRGDERGKEPLEKINTSWKVYKGQYLPDVVDVELTVRSENKVVAKQAWKVLYYWMLDGVSDDFFESTETDMIPALVLKEKIVSYASKHK